MTRDDAGLIIGGRFELGRFLGSGASAAVFEALDLDLRSTVALKMLHSHLAARPGENERFLREVANSPTSPHPDLVSVRASGTHNTGGLDVAWIAVDLAPGITLAESVELLGPLEVVDALAVASAALRGLAVLHARGLVHRDVSPNNLMIDRDTNEPLRPGSVRLIDFGLAEAAGGSATGAALVIGSVNYISPEQARGLPVDERGDLYAVAAVLYFCLTGQPPFPRDNTELTLRAQVNSPPPLPSALRPRLPRELDRLVARGMSKRPEGRFDSAAVMLEAVSALQRRMRPIESMPDSATDATLVRTAVMPSSTARTQLSAPRDAATERFVASSTRSTVSVRRAGPRPVAAGGPPRRSGRRANPLVVVVLAVGAATAAWGVVAAVADPPPAPTKAATAAVAATVPTTPPTVVEADEPRGLTLPSLASLSAAEAQQRIAALGLSLGELVAVDSPLGANTVIGSNPTAGDWVTLGDTVALTVASGSNAVPTVASTSRDSAVAALQAAGFAVITATVEDPVAATGSVLGTSPSGGTSLPLGSTVTVLIAFTTPRPTPTPTPTATPTPTPTPTAPPIRLP